MDTVAGRDHRHEPAGPARIEVASGIRFAVIVGGVSRLQIGDGRLQTRGSANWELIDSVAEENHRQKPVDPAGREAINDLQFAAGLGPRLQIGWKRLRGEILTQGLKDFQKDHRRKNAVARPCFWMLCSVFSRRTPATLCLFDREMFFPPSSAFSGTTLPNLN